MGLRMNGVQRFPLLSIAPWWPVGELQAHQGANQSAGPLTTVAINECELLAGQLMREVTSGLVNA